MKTLPVVLDGRVPGSWYSIQEWNAGAQRWQSNQNTLSKVSKTLTRKEYTVQIDPGQGTQVLITVVMRESPMYAVITID